MKIKEKNGYIFWERVMQFWELELQFVHYILKKIVFAMVQLMQGRY